MRLAQVNPKADPNQRKSFVNPSVYFFLASALQNQADIFQGGTYLGKCGGIRTASILYCTNDVRDLQPHVSDVCASYAIDHDSMVHLSVYIDS